MCRDKVSSYTTLIKILFPLDSEYYIMSCFLRLCHCTPAIELSRVIYIAMLSFTTILVFAQFFVFIGYGIAMEHAIFTRKTGQFLPDSVIVTKYAASELECSMHCTSNDACFSVNYKTSGVNQGLCQLNNKTHSEKLKLASDEKFVHLSVIKRVRHFFCYIMHKLVGRLDICNILE